MQGDHELQGINLAGKRNPFVEFGAHRLPIFRDRKLAKVAKEQLKKKLYKQWLIDNFSDSMIYLSL
jgi:hypothetical protein